MLHVVDARPDVDHRLEGRVGGDVAHLLAVDPHFAVVAQAVAVLVAVADHGRSFLVLQVKGHGAAEVAGRIDERVEGAGYGATTRPI